MREVPRTLEESIPTVGCNGELVDGDDPFRYGWRYVCHVSNGHEAWERVPLTEEDVLHPQLEDYIVQSHVHQSICHYLYTVLRSRMPHIPGGLVLHDVGIEWGVPGMKGHAPDLAVFAEAWNPPQRGVFDLRERSGRVLLVIEVTSPSTRHLDVASDDLHARTRFRQYAQVGIPLYIVVDEARRPRAEAPPPIVGYQLTEDGYRPLPLDEQGRLWVAELELWLGPEGAQVVWFDRQGQRIWEYEEEQAARRAAEEQAQAAEERARDAEERARAEQAARLAAEERARELERWLQQVQDHRRDEAGDARSD
ncbi:MAG: Uma2 family endonuclease [Chloroflexaceae bacterium]|nr:Uma2 family endonuclease [Chloroflexaceae bacterium]